jgi:hypothetical protein
MYSKGSTRKYATVEDSLISATMNLDILKKAYKGLQIFR